MKVRVRYFASVREALGAEETVDLPAGAGTTTIASLRELLIASGERHAAALGRSRVLRSARNLVMAEESTPVHDGDEIGFFPPVTGG